jgi:hypothetical protein
MTMTRTILMGSVALVLATGGWYAFRPERLFIEEVVNEDFPAAEFHVATAEEPMADAPDIPVAEGMDGLDVNSVLYSGAFHSNAHETAGTATIYLLEDGRRILRLTDFRTSNGPDVRVVLVAAEDVRDNATVRRAGYVDLGVMKGNVGSQNYDLPADLDLGRYRSATIWCRRFNVNFGTAPLAPQPR